MRNFGRYHEIGLSPQAAFRSRTSETTVKLQRLTIAGYKSLERLTAFEVRDVNILIGANGSGKSSLLSLFRMMAAIADRGFQTYVRQRGGPDALLTDGRAVTDRITIDLEFERNRYVVELVPTDDNRLVFAREQAMYRTDAGKWYTVDLGSGRDESGLHQSTAPVAKYVHGALRSWRIYHFHDTGDGAPILRLHAIHDNLRFNTNGSNVMAYMIRLRSADPNAERMIVETLRQSLPFFGGFFYRETTEQQVELEWFDIRFPHTPLKGHLLSDGSLRLMCLTILLLHPEPGTDTIIVDEPELGLHPWAISKLAAMVRMAAGHRQVIIATHSADLIDEFTPSDIVVVDRAPDSRSNVHRLDADALKDWLEDYTLGNLWKSNVLGGVL